MDKYDRKFFKTVHFQFLDKYITEQSSAFRPSDATGQGDLEVETVEHLSLQMLVPTAYKYSGDEDPSFCPLLTRRLSSHLPNSGNGSQYIVYRINKQKAREWKDATILMGLIFRFIWQVTVFV